MTMPSRRGSPALMWAAVVTGLVVFAALTAVFVTVSVDASQHRWCAVLADLASNLAPAPRAVHDAGRAYDQRLAADFSRLKESMGC